MIKANTIEPSVGSVGELAKALGLQWDGAKYVKVIRHRASRKVIKALPDRSSTPEWWAQLCSLDIGGDMDITAEAARLKRDTKAMQSRIYQHLHGNPSSRHTHKFIVRHVAKRMIATRVAR